MLHDEDTEDTLSHLVAAEGNLNNAMVQAIDAIASVEGDTLQEHAELFQIWLTTLHVVSEAGPLGKDCAAYIITPYALYIYHLHCALYSLISNSFQLLLYTTSGTLHFF